MNKLIEMNKEFPMEANLAIHLLQQEVMELQDFIWPFRIHQPWATIQAAMEMTGHRLD